MSMRYQVPFATGEVSPVCWFLLLTVAACGVEPDSPDATADARAIIDCAVLDCSTPPLDQCLDGAKLRIFDHRQPGACDPAAGCVHAYSDVPCQCEAGHCLDLPALGEQRVAVVLIDFINNGTRLSVEDMQQVVFDGEYSLNRYYQEASYGRTWLSGDVFGWYPVSGGALHCDRESKDLLELAIGDILSFLDYNRFLLLYRAPFEGCEDYGLGTSTLGQEPIATPDGTVLASLSRVEIDYWLSRPRLPHQQLSAITASVVGHEFGHALGIRAHANLFDCGADMLSTATGACQQEAIADMFSLMSGEGYRRSALHLGACHKRDLGWFVGDEVATVEAASLAAGATTTVVLGPYELLTAGRATVGRIVLATPIPVTTGVAISELYLENRTATGFDSWIADLATAATVYDHLTATSGAGPIAIDVIGVQLRGGFFLNGRCGTTYLLDAHPDSLGHNNTDYSLYDALDSFLNVGQVVAEPYNGLTIRVLQQLADGAVEVEIGKQ